ncbi:acyl-CoA carboxylase subunit beta [Erysipelothrix urinaevulpis]|uniref:acyl-CoA carboxylase subunit beta n=1 Tax=Erysipelothrix urinaevulpis TaxID=2683717 RepID=UPI001916C2B8|nr:carboxyl transferase domain-containing protein [Erysipelothrix urinaevulpis]
MSDSINELKKLKEKIALGGGKDRIEKQYSMGKRTARDRINMLLDEGTFVEVDTFVSTRATNFGMQDKKIAGDGVVTGYGQVDGRLVYVYAQDFTVLGGSLGQQHAQKITKIQKMGIKMGAPIIGINDSGGARIQEGVDALSGYGDIFYNNTIASGVVPQISVIMGPSAGGAVYSPAITDFIFMVENTGKMFITGPEVIKSVTGEEVSQEELGGALTHNAVSGVAHFMDETEEETLNRVKELLSYLPSNNLQTAPSVELSDDENRHDEALNSIVPNDPNKAYNVKDVIEILADNGEFFEVQEHFAKNIVIGYMRLNGEAVGVVANQPNYLAGCLDIDGSDKAARFVRTCDAFNIPLLTLVDVPGFLPGTNQEHNGIIRHGAKLLYAFSEATVPKSTVIMRKAYGGAYIAMCSKHLNTDMVYAWPNAEIAVMGPDGAANIIFRRDINNADDPIAEKDKKVEEYRQAVANPYVAAERGYVDDVIEPSTTRQRLISTYDMLKSKRETRPTKKHGNLPL